MKEKKNLAGAVVFVVGPLERFWNMGSYFNVALAQAYGVETTFLPSRNWLKKPLKAFEKIDLVIVDCDYLPTGGLALMGLDDFCSEYGIAVLVVTDGEHIVPGAEPGTFGGPYPAEKSKNPPWRYVTTLEDIEEARDRFLDYWNS